jgi:hypothetical protein
MTLYVYVHKNRKPLGIKVAGKFESLAAPKAALEAACTLAAPRAASEAAYTLTAPQAAL